MRARRDPADAGVVSVVEALERMGGLATRRALVAVAGRADVDRALAVGDVVALAPGRYALPVVDEARAAAHRLSGIVSHASAALLHGWELHTPPREPHVTVPRGRVLSDGGVVPHWAKLRPGDVDGLATSRERTLVDCLRILPFAEALAIADSALRHGFGRQSLLQLTDMMTGPGAGSARRVAGQATGEAANPFESALRAVVLDVPRLQVSPQVAIHEPHFLARVDLADERLRLVLEADSYAYHGGRAAFARDCRRYNALVLHGWLVLRFGWEDVFLRPSEVRAVVEVAVAGRPQPRIRRPRGA